MARRRRLKSTRLGAKRTPTLTLHQKRKNAAEIVRDENPELFRQLEKIKARAEILVRPTYTRWQYLLEIYDVAWRWKRKGVLESQLKKLATGNSAPVRRGGNELIALVRATSEFDRQTASKYAEQLRSGLSRKPLPTPLHFFQTLSKTG